ncbi:MAG: (S)-ureidoglycine aminohydrolase [Bryobacteraceae bacterium]
MHHLGLTRGALCADHMLQTPNTFVRAPLPGMRNATAIVHIGPARGARFTQYTVEFESGGWLPPASDQRFAYVLEGEIQAGASTLAAGDYIYVPPSAQVDFSASAAARVTVIEKPYLPLPAVEPPDSFTGGASRLPAEPLLGSSALTVQTLIPAEPGFDFAINILTYQPGAALPMVEMHVMEHGLLMLAGGGIYRLSASWYPVQAGDFIWMAPYCPQWFGALGEQPARYIIYKDWNR